jgi:hypothetical protein
MLNPPDALAGPVHETLGAVDGEELPHQRERRARSQELVLMLDLVAVVRRDARLGVDAVALGEIEQRA